MFEGTKRVIFSTSNVIGGLNYTTFLCFLLISVLLFMSALALLFISKRNVEIKELAISVRQKQLTSSLEESPSILSQAKKMESRPSESTNQEL